MTSTVRYQLPLLEAGQSQKEITHNEALFRLDRLVHTTVASRRAAVPASVAPGAAWIVPDTAQGAWAGQAGSIAIDDANGWSFIVPRAGYIAFIEDEAVFAVFTLGAWQTTWPVGALAAGGRVLFATTPAAIAPPADGGVVDIEARHSIRAVIDALRLTGILPTSST